MGRDTGNHILKNYWQKRLKFQFFIPGFIFALIQNKKLTPYQAKDLEDIAVSEGMQQIDKTYLNSTLLCPEMGKGGV